MINHSLSDVSKVSKDLVGLDNVDNTSDLNKPISTATQTALNSKQDKVVSTILTLVSSGWVDKFQSISVTGVTSSSLVYISPTTSSRSVYEDCHIVGTGQSDGYLTFGCDIVPTVDVSVNVVIL